MFVYRSGQVVKLRECEKPTPTPSQTPFCPTPSTSAIPKKKQRHWMYWLKWIAIFVVVAALFYYFCASDKKSPKSYHYSQFPRARSYRFYTR